jgi:DNA modification methylase
MKLTENEIRDITQYLEAGKDLPEKYRFLLFEDKKEVELLWNGKSGDVTNVVLPFQVIEQVDEPRSEEKREMQGSLFDSETGRQVKGWNNKLIWGDNKLILSSLKNGPMRKEIEEQGGIKLIYIDPPFDVGADFSMDIEIGDETLTKNPSVIEEIAYRDTWGKGDDSFLSMIYERLILMKDLLADDGLIFVHCDYRLNSALRLVLNEVFGKENYRNEISSKRKTKNIQSQFEKVHSLNIAFDSIFLYSKNKNHKINVPQKKLTEINEEGKWNNFYNTANRPTMRYELLGIKLTKGQWRWTEENALQAVNNYSEFLEQSTHKTLSAYWEATGKEKRFIRRPEGATRCYYWIPPTEETGVDTNWTDFYGYANNVSYPTAKSTSLLERIIKYFSNEEDLIADFFAGSGVLAEVAEINNRKWICSDLGKFSIHTIRKRIINLQRQLKKIEKNWRAFEILNLGKYERAHYVGVNLNLREEQQQKQLERKEAKFLELILHAYKADKVDQFKTFQGTKSGRLVAVGPINLPVTRLFVEAILLECQQKNVTKADILGFEFEMGLFPNIQEEAKSEGIDLAMKYIPRDVFDKRAIEKNQVAFHDVSYIEVKPHFKKNAIAIELIDFSVYYAQEANASDTLANNKSKVIIINGQVVKITKDKDGITSREVLTSKWTDWVDYWSVDFDFESKQEIISTKDEETGEIIEAWTGEHVFENEWQSFRTKQDRAIELTSSFTECTPGRRKVAVKVVDIFGNDTMKIIEVTI